MYYLTPHRFFVVEEHILTTTHGLVTRAYIDELWDMALTKIVAVLRTHIVRVSNYSDFVNRLGV